MTTLPAVAVVLNTTLLDISEYPVPPASNERLYPVGPWMMGEITWPDVMVPPSSPFHVMTRFPLPEAATATKRPLP